MARITGALHEDQYTFVTISLSVLLRIKTFGAMVVEKIKTHFMSNNSPTPPQKKNLALYEIIWENIVESGRSQMRIACWITEATDSHSEYVILYLLLFHYTNAPRYNVLNIYCLSCLVTC